VPGVVSKRNGVARPNWVSPSTFGPLLTCAMVRCRGGKSIGKCYPIPLTHQTWHLLTITCFRRWASLSGTSILTETSKNDLMSGLPRKIRNFFGLIYKLPERWEKCIVSEGKWINLFLLPRKKKSVFFWLKNSGFKLTPLARKTTRMDVGL